MPAGPAMSGRNRRVAAGAFLLLAALALGILALRTLPRGSARSQWIGYRAFLVEAAIPEAEVLESLAKAGVKGLLSESSEPVLVSNWGGLETMTLSAAKARLIPGDPRFDAYIQRLGLWFQARVGGVAYRAYYAKESSFLGPGAVSERELERGLSAYAGRYRLPEATASAGADGGDGLFWLAAVALILAACLASGRVSSLPRWRGIDTVAFRVALCLPWLALGRGGLTAAVLSSLWGIALADAAEALEMPLEEYLRGGGMRNALRSLSLQPPPALALPFAAILASCANIASLPSLALASLGSIAGISGYALISSGKDARRRFTPMPIARRSRSSRSALSKAAISRATLACGAVVAWGLFRLFSPSIAQAAPSDLAFPSPESIRGSLRPLLSEARQRAPSEGGDRLPSLASYLEHRATQEALPYMRVGEGRTDPFSAARLPEAGSGAADAPGVAFTDDWARAAYAAVPQLSIEGMLLRQGAATVGRLGSGGSGGERPLAPIESLLYIFLLVPPIGRILFSAPFARSAVPGELRQEA